MQFRFIAVATLALACAQLVNAATLGPAPTPALSAIFQREFQRDLQEFPESATYLGIDGYNDRLHDASAEAAARRKAQVKSLLAELAAFDPAALSTQDRISLSIMAYNLRRQDALNSLYGDLRFGAAAMAGCRSRRRAARISGFSRWPRRRLFATRTTMTITSSASMPCRLPSTRLRRSCRPA